MKRGRNPDERRRRLERAAAAGDPEAEQRLFQERVRLGEVVWGRDGVEETVRLFPGQTSGEIARAWGRKTQAATRILEWLEERHRVHSSFEFLYLRRLELLGREEEPVHLRGYGRLLGPGLSPPRRATTTKTRRPVPHKERRKAQRSARRRRRWWHGPDFYFAYWPDWGDELWILLSQEGSTPKDPKDLLTAAVILRAIETHFRQRVSLAASKDDAEQFLADLALYANELEEMARPAPSRLAQVSSRLRSIASDMEPLSEDMYRLWEFESLFSDMRNAPYWEDL